VRIMPVLSSTIGLLPRLKIERTPGSQVSSATTSVIEGPAEVVGINRDDVLKPLTRASRELGDAVSRGELKWSGKEPSLKAPALSNHTVEQLSDTLSNNRE
jgi:hypothetical protein